MIQNHVKSSKHQDGRKALFTKEKRERELVLAAESHDPETPCKGKTLPEEQKLYRAKVVLAFVEAGISLSKMNFPLLRELLEEH